MKIIKTVFCVFFLMLIDVCGAYGTNPPASMPAPQTNNSVNTLADEEPPPGGPIDNNLIFLTFAGLVLGTAVIYKNKIKKASV